MLYNKMSDQQPISRHDEDDEEDLEILRREALNSLHHRKEVVTSCHLPPSQKKNVTVSTTKYSHKRLPPGATYAPIKRGYFPQEQIMSRQPTKPVDNYENIFEKLDINEPYVPQEMCPSSSARSLIVNNNGWNPATRSTTNGYSALYPAQNPKENLGLSVGNVQLSPRSLAFVAKNNDILMRRKVENTSPHYRSPSPFRPLVYNPVSPVYQISPSRWSMTPPPKSKSRSPPPRNRWNYAHRRSDSRSPILRRRTLSRSPPAIGPSSRHNSPHRYSSWSPKYPSNKRLRSRSPSIHTRNKTPHWRMSRSPGRGVRHGEKSKSPVNPIERKRNSPVARRAHKIRVSPNNQNRSSSYGQDSGEVRHHRQRSPRHMTAVAAKSRSRSPNRKFRISNDRSALFPQAVKKDSPSSSNGRRRGDEFAANGYRNRGKKRSVTPVSNKVKINRSRTPERSKRDESRPKRSERNARKTEEGPSHSKSKKSSFTNIAQNITNGRHDENEAAEKSRSSGLEDLRKTEDKQRSMEVTTELSFQNKSQNINEENNKKSENLPDDGKEDNSSDDESADDGIELFPSEESESENEGRFKLAAHTKERGEKVPAPSFTKLGETTVFDVAKDLKDVGHSNSSQKNNSEKHRGDRDRSDRRYESSRRRGDRVKKSEMSRSRNERRRNESGSSRRDYEESSRHNDKRRSERPMFKSTFQAIDNEAASKSSGKRGEEKDVNGKKGTVQPKKKHRTEDEQDSVEKEVVPEKLSSVVNSNSGGGSGSTRTSGKKPIHLRLGAMTNTFKAPKKSSLWSSSQDKMKGKGQTNQRRKSGRLSRAEDQPLNKETNWK